MTRAMRATIIMAILTPFIYGACWALLAAVYLAHWMVTAYERINALPERVRWGGAAGVMILLALISPLFKSDHQYGDLLPVVCDYECQFGHWYRLVQVLTAVLGTWLMCTAHLAWKMIYLIYRRWGYHARIRASASPFMMMLEQRNVTRR